MDCTCIYALSVEEYTTEHSGGGEGLSFSKNTIIK